ncbi:hypothetical protein [Yoonia sp. R2-816]|uniref:DUF7670 domain-containing protein n=1 Tax=Yoonia sp. R2-816 TaxID=3342638 RepID=UPI00372D7826
MRALLVVFALFWFVFALLSGAGQQDQGISVMLRNLPNAMPWLALFIVIYISFRWELAGGLLVVAAGFFSMAFFNALTSPVVLLAVSLPMVVLGSGLILCWFSDRRQTP